MAQEINLPIKLLIENLLSILKEMQGKLGNLKIGSSGYERLSKVIGDIEKRILNLLVAASRPFIDIKLFNGVEKEITAIGDDLTKIGIEARKIKFSDISLTTELANKLKEFDDLIKSINDQLKSVKENAKVAFLGSDIGKLWKDSNPEKAAGSFEAITKAIEIEVNKLESALNNAKKALADYQNTIAISKNITKFMGQGKNGDKYNLEEVLKALGIFDKIFNANNNFKPGGRGILEDWFRSQFTLSDEAIKSILDGSGSAILKAFRDMDQKVTSVFELEKTRITGNAKTAKAETNSGAVLRDNIAAEEAKLSLAKLALSALNDEELKSIKVKQDLENLYNSVKTAREGYVNGITNENRAYLSMGDSANLASNELKNMSDVTDTAKLKISNLDSTVGKLSGVLNFINRYIGLYAIMRKVILGVRSAINNIKELDKNITNIAVVTNMSQSDLWGKIGEYTAIALQYGVATKDVYTVSLLFYQQGLLTNQVMSLTTETLKMAKIAGMEYSDAANAMTVAIRAFKIEMMDAQTVTDTYSALAAKFAVSSSEIANAMEKTASSAANVGMSLESTSAFISVMTLTTRESAQNIGSALKSIISRYGEMKASPSSLINVDGEEVAFNKVDTALKSIGISIKDASGLFRNFDDVIMELAQKWDSLDNNTQRYIATIMAGNRQLSRFIALVSNYDELSRAMSTASEAENASIVLVAKTMDSLESKALQLKNAFSQLYLNLHLEDGLKNLYEILTNIVKTVGKLGTFRGVFIGLTNIFGFGSGLKSIVELTKIGLNALRDKKLKIDTTEAKKDLDEFKKKAEEPINVKLTTTKENILDINNLRNSNIISNSVASNVAGMAALKPELNIEKTLNELYRALSSGLLSRPNGQEIFLNSVGITKASVNDDNTYEALKNSLNLLAQTANNASLGLRNVELSANDSSTAEVTKTSSVLDSAEATYLEALNKRMEADAAVTEALERINNSTTIKKEEVDRLLAALASLESARADEEEARASYEAALADRQESSSGGNSGRGLSINGLMKGIGIASSLTRIGGTALMLSGASRKDTSAELINLGREYSKLLTGIGNALSGFGTGASLGMMTGNPLIALAGGVIGALVSGLGTIIDAIEVTTDEVVEKLLEEAQEANDNSLKKLAEVTNLSGSISNLKSLKNAMYESEEGMNAYKEAMNLMGELYPNLISTFDSAGNAIIDLTKAEEYLIEKRIEAARAARDAALKNIEVRQQLILGAEQIATTLLEEELKYIGRQVKLDNGLTIRIKSTYEADDVVEAENRTTDPEKYLKAVLQWTADRLGLTDENGLSKYLHYLDNPDEIWSLSDLRDWASYVAQHTYTSMGWGRYLTYNNGSWENWAVDWIPGVGAYGKTSLPAAAASFNHENMEKYVALLNDALELGENADIKLTEAVTSDTIEKLRKLYNESTHILDAEGKSMELFFGWINTANLTSSEITNAKNRVLNLIKKYRNESKTYNYQAGLTYAEDYLDTATQFSGLSIEEKSNITGKKIYANLVYLKLKEQYGTDDLVLYANSTDETVKNLFILNALEASKNILLWYNNNLAGIEKFELATNNLVKYKDVNELLVAAGVTEEDPVAAGLILSYIDETIESKRRILELVYNTDGTLNTEGLSSISKLSDEESKRIKLIADRFNGVLDSKDGILYKTIGTYSSYFSDQIIDINNLLEQGQISLANKQLETLDSLSYILSSFSGDILDDLFNIITNISFNDYNSIIDAKTLLELYGENTGKLELVKPLINTLINAELNLLFNVTTLVLELTTLITNAAKEIDSILSTNNSGLSLDKAIEEFDKLSASFNELSSFDLVFTYNAVLGKYVYSTTGLQKAIELRELTMALTAELLRTTNEKYTAFLSTLLAHEDTDNWNMAFIDFDSFKRKIDKIDNIPEELKIYLDQLIKNFFDTDVEHTYNNFIKYIQELINKGAIEAENANKLLQAYISNKKNQYFQAIDWGVLVTNTDFDGTSKFYLEELAKELKVKEIKDWRSGQTVMYLIGEKIYDSLSIEAVLEEYLNTIEDETLREATRIKINEDISLKKVELYLTAISEILNYSANKYLSTATQLLIKESNTNVAKISNSAEGAILAAIIFLNDLAEELNKGTLTLEEYNQNAKSILDKTLFNKGGNQKTLLDFASGTIDSNALESLANILGLKLDDLVNEATGQITDDLNSVLVLDQLTGTYKILGTFEDFVLALQDKFEIIIDKTSQTYLDALKTFNENSIKESTKIQDELVSEINNVTKGKVGDKINLAYFKNSINDNLIEEFSKLGADLTKDGILTLGSNANIPKITSKLADIAAAAGVLVAELEDTLLSTIQLITTLLKNGISGTLSSQNKSDLTAWAKANGIDDLVFTLTADGFKLAEKSAIELYDKLKEIDSLLAKLVFDELNKSLAESNEHYKTIADILARIVQLEKIAPDARTKEYELELLLAKEIYKTRSITDEDDSFNFMSADIPGALKNPLNYWKNVSTMWGTIQDSITSTTDKGLMDAEDFYRIMTQFGSMAEASGTPIAVGAGEFVRNAEDAAKLIEKGYSALSIAADGTAKIDLSKAGIDFKASADDMGDGIDSGIKAIARSQIKMIDAAIAMLEAVDAMQSISTEIDKNGDKKIDFGELFDVNGEGKVTELVLGLLNLLTTTFSITVGGESLSSKLFSKLDPGLLEDFFTLLNNIITNPNIKPEELPGQLLKLIESFFKDETVEVGEGALLKLEINSDTYKDGLYQKIQDAIRKGVTLDDAKKLGIILLIKAQNSALGTLLENLLLQDSTIPLTDALNISAAITETGVIFLNDDKSYSVNYPGFTGGLSYKTVDDAQNALIGYLKTTQLFLNEEVPVRGTTITLKSGAKVNGIVNTETGKTTYTDGTLSYINDSSDTGKAEAQAFFEAHAGDKITTVKGTDSETSVTSNASVEHKITYDANADMWYVGRLPVAQGSNYSAEEIIDLWKKKYASLKNTTTSEDTLGQGNGQDDGEHVVLLKTITIDGTNYTIKVDDKGRVFLNDVEITDATLKDKLISYAQSDGKLDDIVIGEIKLIIKVHTEYLTDESENVKSLEQVKEAVVGSSIESVKNFISKLVLDAKETALREATEKAKEKAVVSLHEHIEKEKGPVLVAKEKAILSAITSIHEHIESAKEETEELSTQIKEVTSTETEIPVSDELIQNANKEILETQENAEELASKTYTVRIVEELYKKNILHGGTGGNWQTNNKSNKNLPNYINATGNVGLAKAQGTLMGELGPELVVSNGRYFVVGQNGPEMVNLAKDAIVFNHLQTKSLLEKGMSSGRGQAVTNEHNAVSYATGNVHGGPAMDIGSTIATLRQLRAQWESILNLSVKDIATKAGGGGGGGGSDTVRNSYIKEVERWYNLLQKIAQLEKEITLLEQERTTIASRMNKRDGYQYFDSLKDSLDALTLEIASYKELLRSQEEYFELRRLELNSSAFSSFYTFDKHGQLKYNDDNNAFAKLADLMSVDDKGMPKYSSKEQYDLILEYGRLYGVDFTEYMKYDSSGKEIAPSSAKGSKGTDEDTQFYTSSVQAFFDVIDSLKKEMQSLHDSIAEYAKKQLELEKKQNEILQAIEDNLIDVESKVMAALEDAAKREIDEMKNAKDALQESNEALIDGLTDQLNRERNMYQNSENETSLEAKRRQLAILQRSGGSASEISSLQAEIDSEAKDLYFDKLQEQIDSIKEASDNLIEKLETQIKLAEEALEYEKEHGLLWDRVYEIMTNLTPEEITDYITTNNSEFWSKSATDFGKENRDLLFKAEQWKGFLKQNVSVEEYAALIAENVANLADAEKLNTEKLKETAKNAADTLLNTKNEENTSDDTKKSKKTDEYKDYLHDKIYHWKKKDKSDKAKHIFKNGKCTICGYSAIDYQKGAISDEYANTIVNNDVEKGKKTLNDAVKTFNTTELLKKTLGGKASGGYVKNPSIGFLAEEGEEAVLNAELTSILRNEILGSNRNSLMNLLLDFREAYSGLSDSVYSSVNNNDSSVVILHAEVNMHVDLLANGYDSSKAADDVMREMLNIARKTNAQNRIGR